MSKGDSEDTLVEQPAIELLAGLDWPTVGSARGLPMVPNVAYGVVDKRR